jgi:GNAT superfamily N-acetyltransferase
MTRVGPDPSEAVDGTWLDLLYVVPEAWGTGIAAELLRWALGRAASNGTTTVRLRVVETQARARRFYEREGWRYDPDVPATSNDFFALLCMRRDVGR